MSITQLNRYVHCTHAHAGSVLEVDGDASYKARKTLTGPMLQGLLGPGFLVPGLTTGGAGAGIATAGLARQQQQQQPQDGGSSEGVQGKAQGQCTAGTGGACARLVNREDAGTYVHVFSHIRQGVAAAFEGRSVHGRHSAPMGVCMAGIQHLWGCAWQAFSTYGVVHGRHSAPICAAVL